VVKIIATESESEVDINIWKGEAGRKGRGEGETGRKGRGEGEAGRKGRGEREAEERREGWGKGKDGERRKIKSTKGE
jgi:hypothetical protein